MKNNLQHIVDYLKGNRKGKAANQVEREAMQDPFLAEALSGYEKHEGDHAAAISKLQQQFKKQENKHKKSTGWWAVAACLVGLLGLSTFLLFRTPASISDVVTIASVQETQAPENADIAVLPDSASNAPLLIAERKEDEIARQKQPAPIFTDDFLVMDEQRALSDIIIQEEKAEIVADAIAAPVSLEEKADTFVQTEANKQALNEAIVVAAYDAAKRSAAVVNVKIKDSLSEVNQDNETDKQPIASTPVAGKKAFEKYLKKNIQQPADSLCATAKGDVVLTFYIDENGVPYNFEIKKSLCQSCDEEAIRLIREGGKWTLSSQPAEQTITFKGKK